MKHYSIPELEAHLAEVTVELTRDEPAHPRDQLEKELRLTRKEIDARRKRILDAAAGGPSSVEYGDGRAPRRSTAGDASRHRIAP